MIEKRLLPALLVAMMLGACENGAPPESIGPIGSPLPGLDSARLAVFEEGKLLFDRDFTPEEGLGPLFNQRRCSSCHDLPVLGGEGEEPITKATRYDGPGRCDLLIEFGGDNIQESATPLLRELGIPFEVIPDTANALAPIRPPPLFGVGLIEAIREADIRAGEDPEDADGDGISGKAGLTRDGLMGRFGKKAEFANLPDFIDGAIRFELGITTPRHPFEETVNGTPVPPESDPAEDPEIDARRLGLLIDYVRYLAAPQRKMPDNAAAIDTIEQGEQVFEAIGCTSCHRPAFVTGSSPVPSLSGRTVRLYSDLLLHDMGEDLASACGLNASPSEWRTAPLMGLGERLRYMHDGRGGSYDQVLRLHGGEAARARAAYGSLSETGRVALFRFLASL
jgi:CxxC motif-containing protein (DUF1111 family)